MGSVIVIIITTLLFAAFFSGMEIAFTSSNKLKLEIDRKQKGPFGRIADVFVKNQGQYLTTTLVGVNIVLVIYSLNMSLLIHGLAGRWGMPIGGTWSILIETVVSTIIMIFLGEFIPKALVKIKPNAWLKALSLPMYFFYVLLYPIAKFSTWVSYLIMRIFGLKVGNGDAIRSFEKIDLENLLEETAPDTQAKQENEFRIFLNAMDFSDLQVRDCMVPRIDVEAVDVNSSVEEITAHFIESQYSRIFVWEGSIDNIIGYINIKSLFRSPCDIKECMINATYVPETMPAEQLLELFTKNRISIAVVIDEFGGTAGIISLEDVLEEIFGEIDDEHDTPEMIEKVTREGEYVLSSRLEVKYLNEKYDLGIEEDEEYDTLAGFIIYHQNGIPAEGEVINIGNKRIKILKSSSSRLELVKMKIL